EGIKQRVLAQRADGGELPEREDLAKRGRGAQRVDRWLAQTVESPADRFLHALRDGKFVRLLSRPATVLAVDLTLLDQRLHDLLDKEGIAFGLAVQRRGEFLGHAFLPEESGEQRVRVGERQTAKRKACRQSLAVPIDERGGEWVSAVELDFAIRGEEE